MAVLHTPHYENRQVGEANMPFEVPESWEWTNLGEITNYGNCENVDVNDIPSDGWVLELEDLEKDSAKIIQRLNKDERDIKGVRHSFHKGDVLYSKLRTYLNKVMVAPEDGFCTTEIIPVTCMSFILPEYLNHVLRSKYFVDYTIQCGYGVKMPRLSTTDACNGQIPLPPYNEQKHIVASVEGWFQIIDILESDKADLEDSIQKIKSKILDLAIHGKLVPQDPNDEPAIELLRRINPKFTPCDNAHYPFNIPERWSWVRLDNLCEIKGGKRIPRGETFSKEPTKHIYIRVTNMKNNTIIENEVKYITEEVYRQIKNYTISSDDLYLTIAGTIGDVGFVPSRFDGMNLTENAAKLTNIVCHKQYLMIALLSSVAQEHFTSKFHQVAQPKLSIETASSTLIPLPPYNEQLRIVTKIEELFAVLDEIQKSIEA